MRKILISVAACLAAAMIASCGQASTPSVPEMSTAAANLQQTAAVVAPTVQAQAGDLQKTAETLATQNPVDLQGAQQTAQALLPTIEAQSPELRATVEALATQLPSGGAGALETMQALTGGVAMPEGIPMAEPANVLVNTPTHITYTTTQLPANVIELYKREMAAAGWSEASDSTSSNDAAQLHFELGGRSAMVKVVRVGDATTVDISLEGA